MSSKPSKTFRFTVLAILLGCLAFVGIRGYVDKRIKDLAGGPPTPTLVAKAAILPGSELNPHDFEVKLLPKKYVHKRAVPAYLKDSLDKNTSIVALEKGETLLWDHLAQGQKRPLSDYLGLTERAISIPVDAFGSLQNMLQVGDRIDIMTLLQPQDLDEEASLKVIVQNALILAIDEAPTRPKKKASSPVQEAKIPVSAPQTLTLRVSPSEAAVLAYAQTQGRLFTSLRNRKDVFIQPLEPVNADYLLRHAEDLPIQPLEKDPKLIIQENTQDSNLSEQPLLLPEQSALIPADFDEILK